METRWRSVLGHAVALCAAAAFLGGAVAAPASAAAAGRWVALGDSFSSGTGSPPYALGTGCQRSAAAYPALLARERPDLALTFLACGGATVEEVIATQLPALTADTALVSLTAGGNDAGFARVLGACVTIGCAPALASARAIVGTTLPGRLDALYAGIRRRAPGATVVVLGYPRLFGRAGCAGTLGITGGERARLNAVAELLDRLLAARAAAHGLRYASAIGPFAGHATCAGGAWLRGLDLRAPSESFHPNRRGHADGYLPLLRDALADAPIAATPEPTGG